MCKLNITTTVRPKTTTTPNNALLRHYSGIILPFVLWKVFVRKKWKPSFLLLLPTTMPLLLLLLIRILFIRDTRWWWWYFQWTRTMQRDKHVRLYSIKKCKCRTKYFFSALGCVFWVALTKKIYSQEYR